MQPPTASSVQLRESSADISEARRQSTTGVRVRELTLIEP